MRITAALLALTALLATACAAPEPVEAPGASEAGETLPPLQDEEKVVSPEMDPLDGTDDTCGLDTMKPFLGKQASDIPADMLPEHARIVAPDSQVTMDYVPTRLNVLTDGNGRVIGLKCG